MLFKFFKLLLKTLIFFLILSVVSVILFRFIRVPITPLMLIRCFEQKSNNKDLILKHDWVGIEKISSNLQLAVICSEDQNYFNHHGFDFDAIEKAIISNKKSKILRGGSTISQQTAKNVFLWPGRSYIRKFFEVYFTILIEFFWSKERIMEVYLNSIEMGNGIYGAQSAALFWFNKKAINLNNDESAAISSILPNPLHYKAKPLSKYILKRKNWILKQMNNWGNQIIYKKDS